MSAALYSLGRFCVRHRYPVLVAWIALMVATAVIANAVGKQTSNNLTLPGTGSTNAQDLLQDNLPNQANGTNPVVMKTVHGALDSGQNATVVNKTVSALEKAPGVIKAVSPLSSEGAGALSKKNNQIGYISLTLDQSPADLTEGEANDIIDAESPATAAGFEVANGGYLGQAVSKPSTESSEAVGLAAAVVILLFTFGTATAMGLPIATAIVGLVTGLAAIGLLGHGIDVPTVGPTLGTMLGLGVGIDYALFIVTRHRGFMEQGHPVDEAAARAVGTAGGAVVFAGGHGGDRPLLARRGPDPDRQRARLLGGDRGADRGDHGRDAAAGAPVDSRQAHRQPSGSVPAPAVPRSPPARVGEVGAGRRQAPAARDAPWHRDPARAGDSGAEPPARPAGQRAGAQVHPDPAVLRPVARGLRPRHQRPVPDRCGLRRQPRPQRSEEAQSGLPAAEPAGAAGGRAGDRAARGRGRAARRGAGSGPAGGLFRAAHQAGEAGLPGRGVPQDAGERPSAREAAEPDRQGERCQGRVAGDARQVGRHGSLHRDRHHRALRGLDGGPRAPPALTGDPGRAQGDDPHRLRRRPDRRVHRPRRPDQREAAAGDRDRDRAELPPAPDRLPLDRRAAHGRAHEPAVGGRRLRHPHLRLPGGARRTA